ncbi:MAG: GGDEF domain-containing protein [Dechloromonas sp.]|nr:GGDEF domain-containing protein [Dechloromonas sp.]
MKLIDFSVLVMPDAIPAMVAFGGSFILMTAIFAAGISLDFSVRLFVLYVIPLMAIGLHCERYLSYFAAIGIVLVFEAVTLTKFDIDFRTTITNLFFEGVVAGMIVLVASAARANYLKVLQQSTTDPLTNLANRRAFESIANQEIARQKRYGGIFSLAVLDLDGFKEINDSKGHRTGDEALVLFAKAIRANTREADSVARIGGDEFIVLMPNMTGEVAVSLCHHLREIVAARMAEAGFAVTVSIGMATITQPPESVETVIAWADAAMYEAKKNGKNCVVCAQLASSAMEY